MYLVAIAWLYVALMMAVAEAMHPAGTVVGAVVTFLLYGVGPVSLLMYLLATPLRRRRQRQETAPVVLTPEAASHGPLDTAGATTAAAASTAAGPDPAPGPFTGSQA